jgi:XapX domain-containing protein
MGYDSVDILMRRDGMTQEEAEEFITYNYSQWPDEAFTHSEWQDWESEGKVGNRMDITSAMISLGLGAAVGGVFAFFKAAAPAPQNIEGVAGIVGIFLGWLLISHIAGR